jgi:hypothetical protein
MRLIYMMNLVIFQGVTANWRPFRWPVSACFLLSFFFLTGQAGFALSADRQTGSPDPTADNQHAEIQQKGAKGLQFMGVVDVGDRQLIMLLPGETVDAYYCKQGDFVKNGQVILKLNNDAITNGIAELIIKKNKVKEGIQQLHMAELEKRQREKQLQRIEGKIETEKSLKNQISGYASPVLQQLEIQRLTLVEQLEMSAIHIATLKESSAENDEALKMIKNQVDDLELRRQNLTIKALFDTRVFFLNPSLSRLPPGSVVCELRNEAFHLVRGKIIQHQRNLLKVGDTVKVALDSSTEDSVDGSVQSIEYLKQESREMQGYSSFEVIIRVDAQAKWLQAGMMVSVNK